MLSMDGDFYECSLTDMSCTTLFDLVKELNMPIAAGEQQHFKVRAEPRAPAIKGYPACHVHNDFESSFTSFVMLSALSLLSSLSDPALVARQRT